MKRPGAYIIGRVAAVIAVTVMALLYAVQTPKVQTAISQKALVRLNEQFNGAVSCSEIKILPSGALMVKDLTIIDSAPAYTDPEGNPADTVLTAGRITATFSLAGLFQGSGIHLGKVRIHDIDFHLVAENNGYKANISRVFNAIPVPEPAIYNGKLFDIRSIHATKVHFRLNNLVVPYVKKIENSIGYSDLDVRAEIKGRRISYSHGVIKARASHVSLAEKSGYTVQHLSADVRVAPGKTEIKNIEIEDPWSSIRAKHYNMIFGNVFDFADYIGKVLMEFEFRPSKVSVKTISYFAGIFGNGTNLLDVRTGAMRGYVNDLNISNLDFTDTSSGVSANVSGNISGLPYDQDMVLKASVNSLRFTPAGAEKLLARLVPETKISLPFLKPHSHYILDATANGPINRLKVNARLAAATGSADIKGEVRNLTDPRRPLIADAGVKTHSLDLGDVLGTDALGELTADIALRATLHPDSPEFLLDSLNIHSFDALGYRYNSIRSSASLIGKRARLSLNSQDPKFKVRAVALADLGSDSSSRQYTVDASFDSVDLHALGLDKREESMISGNVSGDFNQNGYYINGYGLIQDLSFEGSGGKKELGDVMITAYNFAAEQNIRVKAPFASVTMSAGGSAADIIDDLMHLTLKRELPALSGEQWAARQTGNLHLDMEVLDAQGLLSFVAPGVYVANGTKLSLDMLDNGEVMALATSDRIAYGTNFLRNLDLRADNMGSSLNLELKGSVLRFGGLEVDSPTVSAKARGNSFGVDFGFNDCGVIGNDGRIGVRGAIMRDTTGVLALQSRFEDSFINTDHGSWQFSDSGLTMRGKDFSIDSFSLSNGEQLISVSGGIAYSHDDNLKMEIKQLDLSIASAFGGLLSSLEGLADGSAELHTGPGKGMGLVMNLDMDKLRLGGIDMGTIRFASEYSDDDENMDVYLLNELDGRHCLYAKGEFIPGQTRLNLNASLMEFPVDFASALSDGALSLVDGSISGNIDLRIDRNGVIALGDNLTLDSVRLQPTVTGVSYTFDGPFNLDGNALNLSGISIHDNEQGQGSLSGKLDFSDFSKLMLDAALDIDNIKVIDCERSSIGVYGLLRASGNATLSGPLNDLDISANVRTSGPGNVHIRTFGSATGSTSDLLTFTERQVEKDDYEVMLEEYRTTQVLPSGIRIRALVDIQSGVGAYIEMDKNSGNMAYVAPQGRLSLNLRPFEDVFDINGDLTVNDGNYRFSIPGILSKDFDIQSGSTIRFVGNLPDTQLDIDAIYSLKASLGTLITETSSESLKRTVNCGINISDRLRNPRLDFSIDVPDLNPTVRSQVESALNTDDKVQKQFVALLVLGSFIPDEGSGVINSNDILLSNVSSFMSTQVNSIFQKLDIPLDIGLDYHESSTTGRNIFDVAISTQLFNNRVIVGGSVANRNFAGAAGTRGDIIGDLDIQIKLDSGGKYRFNLFSHSADEYSSLLDLSQRNGFGMSFQKEYYSFEEFARSLFKGNKADSTAVRPVQREMNTIVIEAE